MSKVCQICQKRSLKANLVTRGIGRRVTKRTGTRMMPNLRSKRFIINGTSIKLLLCASCLKRIMYEKAQISAEDLQKDHSKHSHLSLSA